SDVCSSDLHNNISSAAQFLLLSNHSNSNSFDRTHITDLIRNIHLTDLFRDILIIEMNLCLYCIWDKINMDIFQCIFDRFLIIQRYFMPDKIECDCPIHSSAINKGKLQFFCQSFCQCTLTAGGKSIYGNNKIVMSTHYSFPPMITPGRLTKGTLVRLPSTML